jgi:hypothetical protein
LSLRSADGFFDELSNQELQRTITLVAALPRCSPLNSRSFGGSRARAVNEVGSVIIA